MAYTHLVYPLGSSCTAPTTLPTVPTGTSEFFVSRPANVMVSANCDNVDTGGNVIAGGCSPIINSLGSTAGLTDGTAFRTVVRFFDKNNQYMKAMICSQRI